MLPDFLFLSSFFFYCSTDHRRVWPLCKVVFSGLATNALNVRNNNNNNNNSTNKHEMERNEVVFFGAALID